MFTFCYMYARLHPLCLNLSIGKSSNMKTDEVKHLRDGDVAVVGAKQVQVQCKV